MLGSPNGPAYGTRPKLVVMKVLCKLRWRKIRNLPVLLHSLHLHSFSALLSLRLSSSFSSSPLITVTSCIFPSVSLHRVFPFASYLFSYYLRIFCFQLPFVLSFALLSFSSGTLGSVSPFSRLFAFRHTLIHSSPSLS